MSQKNTVIEKETKQEDPESGEKSYNLSQVVVIILIILFFAFLFNTTATKKWAARLPIGPFRTITLTIAEGLDIFAEITDLNKPAQFLRENFLLAADIKTDAGWQSSDEEDPFAALISENNSSGGDTNETLLAEENGSTADENSTKVVILPEIEFQKTYTAKDPLKVLLIGDSMMVALSTMYNKALINDPRFVTNTESHYSTGLSRPDFYNWPAKVQELFEESDYDLTIAIMGMNDSQHVNDSGQFYYHSTPEWFELYKKRFTAFLTFLTQKSEMVYWVGPPVMREPGYSKRMEDLDALYKEVCDTFEKARHISTTRILTNDGETYTDYLRIQDSQVKVRIIDGKHFTFEGAQLVVNKILLMMDEDFQFQSIQDALRTY